MSPQNLNNLENQQPIILSNNPSKKRLIVLLLVLALVAILSAGYFLMSKTSEVPTFLTENPSAVKPVKNETEIKTENTNVSEEKDYQVSNNIVYYQDREIIGADASTFQELGDGWAKDKNTVYKDGTKQAFIDPATVKVFPYAHVVDKTAVWVYGFFGDEFYMRVEKTDADPTTFLVINGGYGKDKNNIYYFTEKIVNADVQSFVFLGNGYAKDKNKVYSGGEILVGADASTFQELEDGWAKDKIHVFYQGKMLNIEIDTAFFEVIGIGAIKDNKRVYFLDYDVVDILEYKYNLVANADAPTFQHIGVCRSVEMSSGSYFKDKNRVFAGNIALDSIDVLSFEYLGNYVVTEGMPYSVSYAKDKNAVYHSCGEILAGADRSTFVDLKDGYARDKSKAWYLADVIAGADTATFQSLGNGYAKDKSKAYFGGLVIDKADVATFVIVKKNVSVNQFRDVYAKDKNNVYLGNQTMEGVSPASCTVETIDNCMARFESNF